MAVDMFIKIGDLKGEAQDQKHKDEIDVLSWNWGVSNSGSTHVGGGALGLLVRVMARSNKSGKSY